MRDMELVLSAYNISSFYRVFITYLGCCCSSRRKELRKKYFMNEWINLKKASSPDEINWQNLGYSGLNRNIRKYITYLIALCLIFLSFLAII